MLAHIVLLMKRVWTSASLFISNTHFVSLPFPLSHSPSKQNLVLLRGFLSLPLSHTHLVDIALQVVQSGLAGLTRVVGRLVGAGLGGWGGGGRVRGKVKGTGRVRDGFRDLVRDGFRDLVRDGFRDLVRDGFRNWVRG